MQVTDDVRASGRITFYTFDGDLPDMNATEMERLLDGKYPSAWKRLTRSQTFTNLVVNVGRQQMTSRVINGNTVLIPGWIALGTSAITPAATDTVTTGEFFRKACSIIQTISTYYQRYVMYAATGDFNQAGIVGAFLLDANSGGNLWADATVSTSKNGTQALISDWRIQIV